jgi:F-type H+-transporting ATPase subunit delta
LAKAPTVKRYAQALFAIAGEQGKGEAWLDELGFARDALSEPTVRLYMGTPRVPIEDKQSAVTGLMEGRDPVVAKLVGLLVSRQSSGLLGAIALAYGELLNESLGRVQAAVTTAAPMSSEQQERLRETLGKMLNKEVVLEVAEDPEIIGGALVRVGDQVIDGSVRTRLVALRQRLERGSLA